MPELPEVETVRNTLKPLIIGRKIIKVITPYQKIIKSPDVSVFKQRLVNQEFKDIRRYGKYILFDFEDYTLVSHLRMEGKYFIRNSLKELTKHEHIIFQLDNKQFLTYHDVRKFGTMELVGLKEEKSLTSIKVLGREVNADNLTAQYLYPLIKSSSAPIKTLLLNQHIITGLGNIYVDETLYLAKIHPEKPGKDLSIYQIEKIIRLAKKTIKKAILLGGTTIRTYQSSLGVDGRFQNELNVHTLAGRQCRNCHDTIVKIRVGGRGTYLCPTCQNLKKPLVIGLTGGISSGKSVIANLFKKQKITVLDADQIYKSLLKNNKIMYNNIIEEFGEAIITNKSLDKTKLANLIFNDEFKRKKLNKITHPYILKKIKEEIEKTTEKIIVVDIPLLFEAKMDYLANIIILVYVNEETQIERLCKREKITKAQALLKIKAQMPLQEKIKKADIVIDNNYDLENTKKQFTKILDTLRSDEFVS